MPKKPIRVAVIGAGNMGRHHVRNYSELKDAELVAVADSNPETKKLATQHNAQYFSTYQEMLDSVETDAVSIAVPTKFHHMIGTYVMGRGIHCLIEKPIASNVDEADELIALAKNKKLVFTVGHIERYNPVVRKIREVVAEGKVGEVTSIVAKRVGGFPAVEPTTDVIFDLAVHDIDILNFLLGRYPVNLSSHGSRTIHSKKIDSAEILLDYGAASGFVQANWITPVKVRTIAITGTEGYLEANYITQKLELYRHNLPLPQNFEKFVAGAEPNKQTIAVSFEEPLKLELQTFLDAIQGKQASELVDPKDAREAIKIAASAIAISEMRI